MLLMIIRININLFIIFFIDFNICCRMWDVDRDENYILGLKTNDVVDTTEMISCVAFCQAKGQELLYMNFISP